MTLTGHFEPSLTGVLAVRYFWSRDRFQGKRMFAILDQVVPTKGELVAWTTAPKPSRDRPLA
jgi:hypothetical protein